MSSALTVGFRTPPLDSFVMMVFAEILKRLRQEKISRQEQPI